jgi:hypothetical protein
MHSLLWPQASSELFRCQLTAGAFDGVSVTQSDFEQIQARFQFGCESTPGVNRLLWDRPIFTAITSCV